MNYSQLAKRTLFGVWMALVGLAAISHLRPTTYLVPFGDELFLHLTLSGGNFRVVSLRAEFAASYVEETPLDEYAQAWSGIVTERYSCYARKFTLSGGTVIHERIINLTLWAPILLLTCLLLPRRFNSRARVLVWTVIREIVRPSDHHRVRRYRRYVCRISVAFCLLGLAILSMLIWVSVAGMPTIRTFPWKDMSVYTSRTYAILAESGKESVELELWHGVVTLAWSCRFTQAPEVAEQEFRFAGFEWWQRAPTLELSELLDGPGSNFTTRFWHVPYRIAVLPLWMPVGLLVLWPVIAFLRGPLRRARLVLKGLCRNCGYDLEGNVTGVCPECGSDSPKTQATGNRRTP